MGTTQFDFDGETVLVTGASSGIGRAVALRFADAGATVVIADATEDPKDEDADRPTHRRIEAEDGTAGFVECDVSDPGAVERAVETTREYGGLDVMVNNAGIHTMESLLDASEQQFDRIHDVNVKGYFFGAQAAAREMVDRGTEGVVLNVASVSSTMAKPRQILYESTKGAIRMVTRSAALELADHGIRVNAVAPGRVATEFTEMSADEMRRSVDEGDLLKPIPLGRSGVPDDVTGAALFLASDDASYVTGETVYVDGGYQVL